jgi:glucose-6-phosphate isomerase
MSDKFQNSKYVFFVGIGGSDLASKAVWQALTLHKPEIDKKVFFLEAPDSREYEEVAYFVNETIVDLDEVLLLVVSKSGQTAETLETYHKTFDILSEKFGQPITDRVLVISSPGSVLSKLAESKNIARLDWEGDVGGRFSAFTVAHTTFLKIVGFDVSAYLSGNAEMKKRCAGDNSPAKILAQNIFDNYKRGLDILDFFIFNTELEDLGKWCRQLIAESLATITPTVSLGPTDLHSMLELYLGGPKNRFTLFVRSLKELDGSLNIEAYQNVSEAYQKASLPFEKYEMEKIDEYNIGAFMSFMIETTLELAKLLDVDPYGQPAVEEYKQNLTDNQ